jgi:CRP-like cAMP-binding protein
VRIDVKLSQTDLGRLVGNARESVNKQLKVWRDCGVLSMDGRYLVLHRPEALQRLFEP